MVCLAVSLNLGAQDLTDEQLSTRLDQIVDTLTNDPAHAWAELEAIRADAENADDRELWADWNIIAAYSKVDVADLDQAAAFIEESLKIYRDLESLEGELDALLVRGRINTSTGQYREAIQDFQMVLQSTIGLEDVDPEDIRYYEAAAHQSLGDAFTVVGDFSSALSHLQSAYRIYDELGDIPAKSVTIGILGNLYVDLDAAEKALETYQEGARLDRERGDELNVAINLYNMGRAYTDLGDHESARRHYEESLEIAERLGSMVTVGYIYYGGGLSFAEEGRDDEAAASFQRAEEILGDVQDEYMLSKTRIQLAHIAARAGDHPASNALLIRVLPTLESADAEKDLVDVYALLARNHAAVGEYERAYEHSASRSEVMKNIASEERARRTAHLRVQFESERTEAENRALNEENRLKAQMLEKERLFNRAVGIGAFILLLIAIALSYSIWRQKQLERSLTMLANTDDLTGLLNRRRLFELGNHEVHRAIRYEQDLAILVLDLDHFKKINDRYGHAVGDVVLRRVAIHVAGGLREEDWMGRFGGEEFVAVLPHTPRDQAVDVAERLREDVEALDLSGCAVEGFLTLSIGVAWLGGRGDSFQMMVNRADAALYDAKAAGRNRVMVQSESEESAAAG